MSKQVELTVCDPRLGWSHATDLEFDTFEEADAHAMLLRKTKRTLQFAIRDAAYRGSYHYEPKTKCWSNIIACSRIKSGGAK